MPTADGLLYFKEAEPALAHEVRLIDILARRRPELVTEVAVLGERGRMLMRDAGPQLSAILEQDLDLRYWQEALPLYAELQLDAASDANGFLVAGAFDRRAAVLPALYESLLALDPEGVTAEEGKQLRALIPEVVRVCGALEASRVPETINNDDFTDGSIHVTGGAYRFLDWGDSCVSPPFFTLTVTLRVIEIRHGLAPGSPEIERIRDAYLEPFTGYASLADLVPLAADARRVGQICRAALRAENPHWEEPDALAWSLRLLLDPEVWRTWED